MYQTCIKVIYNLNSKYYFFLSFIFIILFDFMLEISKR